MSARPAATADAVRKVAVLGCGSMAAALLAALGRENAGAPPFEVAILNRTPQSACTAVATCPSLAPQARSTSCSMVPTSLSSGSSPMT